MGIEPTSSAWKAEVLPLNYTRLFIKHFFDAQKILTVLIFETVGIFRIYNVCLPKRATATPLTVVL